MSGARAGWLRFQPEWCLCLLLLIPGSAGAGELASGKAVLSVRPEGSGLVDGIRFGSRKVVAARKEAGGATIFLTPGAASGTLFPRELAATLRATIRDIEAVDGKLEIRGVYTDGTVEVPFSRKIEPAAEKGSFRLAEEVDFTALGARYRVAGHSLELPLHVCDDEHLRMFAFGGDRRVEMFRMDMNDEPRRNQLISDCRAFRPCWDLGGVDQRPGGYRIWRANHSDTFAYPVEEGMGAPGWADYSEPEWGMTVHVVEPEEVSPWSLRIDARRGVLAVLPYPPTALPRAGKHLGRRSFQCVLTLHEASWPAGFPCELPFDGYRRLLRQLNRGERFTHLDFALRALGIAAGEGSKTADELEDVARRVMLRERVQPSVILRLLYRGDAWRMQGLVRELLGESVPRNMELEEWEPFAQRVLDLYRRKAATDP